MGKKGKKGKKKQNKEARREEKQRREAKALYRRACAAIKAGREVDAGPLFKEAAEKGHTRSQGDVGLGYYAGSHGLPKDHAKALAWVCKAGAQGDHFARLLLGRMFKRGEGGAGDFDGLLVKESTEIVTLGIPPAELSFRDGGARLSPAQFREGVMAVAAATDGGGDTVLIDCRNAYESRIGRFDGALAPPTRQFSDFPAWCREHRSELQGRNVLMYCTGGIRCERASAYVLGPEVGAAAVGPVSYTHLTLPTICSV